ncbi:hypothetical protein ACQ4PT_051383 [Festuca glaucescens]
MASTKGLLAVLTLLLAAAFLVAAGAAGRTQAEEEAEAGVPRGYSHHGGVNSGADAHGSGCRRGCCGTRGCLPCCANADEIPETMYRPAVEVHN